MKKIMKPLLSGHPGWGGHYPDRCGCCRPRQAHRHYLGKKTLEDS